jgi:hypothetical protein
MRVPAQQHATARMDRPGIEKTIMLYQGSEKNRWKDLCTVVDTKLGFYRALQYGGFGNASIVNAGQSINSDDFQTPFYKDISPKKRGIMYLEASEVGETDQTGITGKRAKAMALAMLSTKEAVVADMFNNFTSTNAAYTGPDGDPLVSTSHDLDTGSTGTNRPATDIALGALNLEQAIQELQLQDNHRGEPMPAEGPYDLLVPIQLLGVANRIVKASGLAQSANNDPNWAGGLIRKIHANPRFTSATQWGLKDVGTENILLVQRRAVKVKSQEDITRDGTLYTITEIYAPVNVNWRGFWGTAP